MEEKTVKYCSKCGKVTPTSEFSKHRGRHDGMQSYCKDCQRAVHQNVFPKHIDRVGFLEDTHILTIPQLQAKYGAAACTIFYWKRVLKNQGCDVGTVRKTGIRTTVNDYEPEFPKTEPAGFPESLSRNRDDYREICEDRVLVFGDVEVPDHDVRVLDMAYRIAERYGITTGILNGDFWAMESFSRWPKTHPTQYEFLKDELAPGTEILKTFMRQFDRLTLVQGNHEKRLNRAVGGQFDVQIFFEHIDQLLGVEYSPHPYLNLISADTRILVGHPQNFRKKPGSLPLELCTNFLCNVILGHLHRLSFQFHPSGQFWGVEGGHCRDTKKCEYRMMQLSTHPIWNPGFVMVLDGWPHLIMPQTFEAYMRPYLDIEVERKAEESGDRT